MLRRVQLKKKHLDDYKEVAGPEVLATLRQLAGPLQGLRVLHINSTGEGGGVAELLMSLVPLMRDAGLEAEWQVLCHDDPFFEVTKGFHNALQGKPFALNEERRERYLRRNRTCAAMLEGSYDVIIAHDPQPAGLRSFRPDAAAHWIWRCHIDTSRPDPEVWGFVKPFVSLYERSVFTMVEFVPPDLSGPVVAIIAPAIDPHSPKNQDLSRSHARASVAEFGVDLTRPLLLQVARFDPWKDPEGAIQTYRIAKKEVPGLQLALIGAMAADDPEGWEIYARLEAPAAADPDIFLFTNLTGVQAHEVNAFQRVADVQLQKSIREGFGLVVSEALWKETPVIGGRVGGITLQIEDGVSGYLVDDSEEAAERVIRICRDPELAGQMGQAGRRCVRERFLITRLLEDWLRLLNDVIAKGDDKPEKVEAHR
ncbi:MAG: glycosyltransferase [Bryobacteraceae bacterium]